MKKVALKIFILTLSMFYCCKIYAFEIQNIEQENERINFLGTQIDKCKDDFLEAQKNNNYDNGSYNHYKKFMTNNEQVRDCYEGIAKIIFKEFYNDKYEEMIEQYKNFVENTYQRYVLAYGYSKYCRKNCGLLPEMKATQSTTYDIQSYLINILDSLEKFATTYSD